MLAGIILSGVQLQARSGTFMMGTLFEPVVRWTFDTPARHFGGYFGTVNTVPGATAHFYDENNTLIGTDELVVPISDWAWNGWESETGISRVEIFGNGVFRGFIFHDDMEYTPIPAPSALIALLGLPIVHARRRRH